MALLQRRGGHMPNIIEQIKSCLEDPDDNGASRRYIGGRTKRERLAAIASNLGVEAASKPWVGHVLALLFESLDIGAVNKIMTHGPGRKYQEEWDKWELAAGRPAWENKRGEDKIRKLVYDLLMPDLIMLYNGYELEGGLQVRRLSVREVCKKVEDEIGLVVIKESHFRDQLRLHGVPLRNLKGEAVMPKDKHSQSMGSPSTLGAQTPAPTDITHESPQSKSTSRLSPSHLSGPSRLPIPVHPSSSHAPIKRSDPPNAIATTHGSNQDQFSPHTNYVNQDYVDRLDNLGFFQQQNPQNTRDTPIPPSSAGLNLDLASPAGTEINGIDEDFDHSQPVPSPFGIMPFSSNNSDNDNSPLSSTGVHNSVPLDYCNTLTTFVGPAEAHSNNVLTQLVEGMQGLTRRLESESMAVKILTRRLDTESAARMQLEIRANEVDVWQNKFVSLGESYKALTSGYRSQETQIESLRQKCESLERDRVSEKTKREELSEEMESLHQRYYGIDGTIKKLQNDNGALQSEVLSLQGLNEMGAERINHLQTGLRKLQAENTELKTDLGLFKAHNDTLRADVTKLQAANTKERERTIRLNDKNAKLISQVETLQQQKCGLEDDVANLQAENLNLKTQITNLHKAKEDLSHQVVVLETENASLVAEKLELETQATQLQQDKEDLGNKVDFMEGENASLQQENKSIRTKANKESQDRLSSCTIDSGIGASPRSSIARKRQISITNEREEKRHRSMNFYDEDTGTFLVDPDPEELPIMSTSNLPIRSGSRSE